MANFTGNELILAHNTLQGLLKLADLLQYIQDNITTEPSGSGLSDIEFSVTDLNVLNQGRFQLSLTPTPAQNLEHVRYVVIGDQRVVVNTIGQVWVDGATPEEFGTIHFSILAVADGFSKILYCVLNYQTVDFTTTFELNYSDNPIVNEE